MTHLLTIENLKTIYKTPLGDVTGIENISLRLARNRRFGLVGESGCGKTTLLKSIIGVLPENAAISHGSINFDGIELTTLTNEAMNRIRWNRMAMITQSAMNALDPVYTIGHQITEAIKTHKKVSRKQSRSMIEEMFSLVGIDKNRFNDYPHQFSGGMRQRAIIAMSLILKPDLVIADEPTTSLDVIVQDQIFQNMRRLQEHIGFSILLVTHDIALVIENCDDIAVMYGGRIMEVGPMKSVIKDSYHPYTMGLKNAFPNIRDRTAELISIPGAPPSLLGDLNGCRFTQRCPFADKLCGEQTPPLKRVGHEHFAACHHLDQVETMRLRATHAETWLSMVKS